MRYGNAGTDMVLTVGSRLLVADGVGVRVDTVVAGEAVEQDVRRRGNVVGVDVGDTAGTHAGAVVGTWQREKLACD